MSLLKKLSPFYTLTLFYIIVSLVLRVVLLFHPITQASFSGVDTLKIFTIGILSDSLVFIVLSSLLSVVVMTSCSTYFSILIAYLSVISYFKELKC